MTMGQLLIWHDSCAEADAESDVWHLLSPPGKGAEGIAPGIIHRLPQLADNAYGLPKGEQWIFAPRLKNRIF